MDKNVRVLMTDEVGRAHNGYIDKYLLTGVKTVVDNRSEVTGKRSDGVLVRCELHVLEIVLPGNGRTFVAAIQDITEKEHMTRVNAINARIVKMVASPVIVANQLGIVASFNHAAETMFGWSSSDIVGKNVSLLQPDDVAAKHDSILAEYRRTRKRRIIDAPRVVFAKKRGGDIFTGEILVKEVSGELFMASVRDTTLDREDADLDARVNAVMENPLFMLVSIDSSGNVTAFNKCAEETLLFNRADVLGKNLRFSILPDEIARNHDSYIRSYLRSGVKRILNTTTQSTAKRSDGVIIPIELQVCELRQDSIVSFMACAKDKLAAQASVLNSLLKDSLVETCPTPLVTTDIYGTVLTWPPAAQAEIGWAPDDIIGRNIKLVQPDYVARNHDKYLKAYRKTGVKHVMDSHREVVVRRKDKTTYACDLCLREINNADGRFFVGSLRNIEAQHEVQKKEEQSQQLLDLTLSAFVAIDAVGTVTLFNAVACRLWGYKKHEVIGKNVKMLMADPHRSKHDAYLSNYAKTRRRKILNAMQHLTIHCKDGSIRAIELTVKEVSPEAFVAQVLDTTTNMQRVEDGKIAEALHTLSPTALITINEFGTVLTTNCAALKLFGYKQDEVVGGNISKLCPDDIAIFHDGYLERYNTTGVKRVIGTPRQLKGKRKDGELFNIRLSVAEIIVCGNKIFVGCVVPIDNELQMAAEVSKTNEVLSLSTLGVIAIKIDGIMRRINRVVLERFGYTEDECLGQNVKMLMPTHIANNHDTFLQNYKKHGQKRVIGNKTALVGKRKDGSQFVVELAVREILMEGHDPVYLGYVRDMTEEERLKEAFELCSVIASLSVVPVISIDVNGHIVKYTNSAERAWGWAPSEVLSQKVEMLMPKDTAKKHQGYVDAYTKTGQAHVIGKTVRLTAMRKDKSLFYVKLTVREIPGSEFFLPTFIAFAEDQTEIDNNKLSIQINDVLVKTSVIPIIMMDTSGLIKLMNPSANELFGYQDQEIVGENVKVIVSPDHQDKHDGYLARYLETGVKTIIDTTRNVIGRKKDGSPLPVVLKVREVKLQSLPPQYLAYVQPQEDLTRYERAQANNQLLIELVELPVVVISELGMIHKFSPAAEAAFGWKASDILSRSVNTLMPDSFAAVHDDRLLAYVRTMRRTMVGATTEITCKARSGLEFQANITVHPISTERATFFVGLFKLLS
ncbi:hypothetical protein DIPPA_19656 [Diplonema papillatum]|nr:hypothetical protein DIPPA_10981 [Diplonema papillatum]KAJ9448468.1 hypothetical protein DIPPA_19656 [Diplonema papillatum]